MPRYQLQLKSLDEPEDEQRSLEIEIKNHDDIFKIIDVMKNKALLPDDQAEEFIIGLKLFTEVILRHRTHPLFEELSPQIRDFMKKLKAS